VSQQRRDGLAGIRVGLLEARMGSELGELVRRHGGAVRSAPAVREAALDCADLVSEFLNRLRTPALRVHVFLTGAGAAALLQEADRLGELMFLTDSLRAGTVVCRGPKPAVALKRYGLNANLSAASPYTSRELLAAMEDIDVDGVEVTVVHYGERSGALADELAMRGARLDELCLYEWRLPENIGPLQDMARAIVKREVDAVIFTSQVQWKHLLRVASDLDLAGALRQALNDGIVVASVGPICSATLVEAGVRPHVVPDNPKMGPLVAALAEHFSARPRAHDPHDPYDPFIPQTGGG
jgi:uroporphyrinogen-III synthase